MSTIHAGMAGWKGIDVASLMTMMKSAMFVSVIRCFCCFLAAQIFAALLLSERRSGNLLRVKSER